MNRAASRVGLSVEALALQSGTGPVMTAISRVVAASTLLCLLSSVVVGCLAAGVIEHWDGARWTVSKAVR